MRRSNEEGMSILWSVGLTVCDQRITHRRDATRFSLRKLASHRCLRRVTPRLRQIHLHENCRFLALVTLFVTSDGAESVNGHQIAQIASCYCLGWIAGIVVGMWRRRSVSGIERFSHLGRTNFVLERT